MQIGVPKEIEDLEFRVGLSPDSVRVLTDRGHSVFVETGAGVGSGFSDRDYQRSGATIVANNYQLVHPVVRQVFPDLVARVAEFSLT